MFRKIFPLLLWLVLAVLALAARSVKPAPNPASGDIAPTHASTPVPFRICPAVDPATTSTPPASAMMVRPTATATPTSKPTTGMPAPSATRTPARTATPSHRHQPHSICLSKLPVRRPSRRSARQQRLACSLNLRCQKHLTTFPTILSTRCLHTLTAAARWKM